MHESHEESINLLGDAPLTSLTALYTSAPSHGKSKNKYNRGKSSGWVDSKGGGIILMFLHKALKDYTKLILAIKPTGNLVSSVHLCSNMSSDCSPLPLAHLSSNRQQHQLTRNCIQLQDFCCCSGIFTTTTAAYLCTTSTAFPCLS